MSTPLLQRIVLATQLGPHSRRLLAHGLRLALSSGARLCVIHAPRGDGPPPDWDVRAVLADIIKGWATLADQPGGTINLDRVDLIQITAAADAPLSAPLSGTLSGTLTALSHTAGELGPDLLLLGSERRLGLERILRGSTAERLARQFSVGTLFVGQGATGLVQADTGVLRIDRVLVPVGDGIHPSDAADAARSFLVAIGHGDTPIDLYHAGPSLDGLTELVSERPPKLRWRWSKRPVVAGILEEAAACASDLIVMVTRGHDSIRDGLLGSHTERVMRQAPCPVLAVPLTL